MADWQVGDLAVCVDDGPHAYTGFNKFQNLRRGNAYTVAGFWTRDSDGGLNLIMGGFNHTMGWSAARFRKVAPDKHEPCEAEFVTLLNRTKQPVFDAIEGKRV